MKTHRAASILLLLLPVGVHHLHAQLHPGVPSSAQDEGLLSAVTGITDHGGRYAEIRYAAAWIEGVSVMAALGRSSFGKGDPPGYPLAAGLGTDATPWPARRSVTLPPSLYVLPRAEVVLSKLDDLGTASLWLRAPVGWAWAPEFENWAVFPYLAPALVGRWASVEGHRREGWYGGLEGGVALGVERFILALELERVWTPSWEDRVQASAGILF